MIYLDYSANTPADPAVLEAFCRTEQTYIGNPNSTHPAGQAAQAEMARVTESIAGLLRVSPEEIIYTSGASESNNLARRSIKQVESEKKIVQSELRKSEMRIEIIPKLLKTLYEDKFSGKTSEDNYCVLSQEYSDEREQLQKKILKLRGKLTEMGEKENEREEFIHAIRKFMEMRTLTKQVLNELIDHIDVYETQGTGKNKTQRLVIYYKFVGYLDIDPTQCHPSYTADIREGVAIEYVSCEPPENLKELFPEGYNADDDSFEEEEMEQA